MSPRLIATLALLAAACSSPDEELAPDAQAAQADARTAVAEPDAAPTIDVDAAEADATVIVEADAAPELGDHPHPTPEGCTDWAVAMSPQATTNTTVEIVDGLLVLANNGAAGGGSLFSPLGAVALYQAPFRGDFDVIVAIDDVEGGDIFAGVNLFAAHTILSDSFMRASFSGGGGLFTYSSSDHMSWSAHTGNAGATLHLKRVNDWVTVSADSGNDDVNSLTSWMGGDIVVGISIPGVEDGVKARISRVTITGGGDAVHSDDFDCARIVAP